MENKLKQGDLCIAEGYEGVFAFIRMYPSSDNIAIVAQDDEQYIINMSRIKPYNLIDSIDDKWKNGDEVLVGVDIYTYVGKDPRNPEFNAHVLIRSNGTITSIAGSIISTIIKTRKDGV